MMRGQAHRPYQSRLREEQADATRTRILDALAALITEGHPPSMAVGEIAARAGVAEPTVYHHFPTKQDLFRALASRQFGQVTSGLQPYTPDELAAAIRTVYSRSEAIEPLVRWTLSNPLARLTARPHRGERLDLLRTALGEILQSLSPTDAMHLERLALLLSSPLAALYWKDYLGISAGESADSAQWALLRVVDCCREQFTTRPPQQDAKDSLSN
jgi:AcrR family transcriptional regulator